MVKKLFYIFSALLILTISLVMFSDLEDFTKMIIIQLLIFVIGQIIFILSAVYMWRRTHQLLNTSFFLKCEKSRIIKLILTVILVTILIFANLSIFFMVFKFQQPLLATVSFTLFGFYFKLLIFFLITKLICYMVYLLSSFFINYTKSSKLITHQITTITYISSLLIALLLTIYGSYNAWRDPEIRKVNIKIPQFPFSNFTILVLSDIHLGLTVDQARIQHLANIAKTLDYDMLVIVGDLTDLPPNKIHSMLEPIKHINPPYGTYFVTGNHEIYTGDVIGVVEFLRRNLGVVVLRNERVTISLNDSGGEGDNGDGGGGGGDGRDGEGGDGRDGVGGDGRDGGGVENRLKRSFKNNFGINHTDKNINKNNNNKNIKSVKTNMEAGNKYFYLAGVDDIEGKRFNIKGFYPDYSKALIGRKDDHVTILLVHQPKAAKHVIDNYNNVDLIICGHTHGGQFFPFNIVAYLGNPFFKGLYHINKEDVNVNNHNTNNNRSDNKNTENNNNIKEQERLNNRGTYVYVSEGTVYWGIPIRTFSRSEMTILSVHNGD